VLRRDPHQFGHAQARWTLASLFDTCDWLRLSTEGGLSQLLKRLGIRYKRGRDHIHSPDPAYLDKLSLIELCRLRAYYAPDRYAFLYLDQVSYYRQPSLAQAYEVRGPPQPLAERSQRANTRCRGIGALDAVSGQVLYTQHAQITRKQLVAFFQTIVQTYPTCPTIYVTLDNWPVHFHPDVLVYLQPQHFPWPPRLPAHWSTAPSVRPPAERLPIQLLCLPTYASWLNPIEKLWRWLRQTVLHLHRASDDWAGLKQQVLDFFAPFQAGSTQVLHYVGLLPD
jgi:hypothetical protein